MNLTTKQRQILAIIATAILLLVLPFAVFLSQKAQEIRKRAAGAVMSLSLYPVTETINVGQTKLFELKATFTNGSSTEKLDYFKTELSFNSNYIRVPEGKYIDTSESGFGKIIRVDGPTAANEAGKIVLELGALSSGAGPGTDKPVTVAKLYFEGKGVTPSSQDVKIGETQAVNNQSSSVNTTSQSAKYFVTLATGPTPTIGNPQTTATVSDNFDGASLDTNVWIPWIYPASASATASVNQENGLIRGRITSSSIFDHQGTGLDLKDKIKDDFEQTVDLSNELSSAPWSDTLLVFHDDDWKNNFYIALRKAVDTPYQLAAGVVINGQDQGIATQPMDNGGPVTVKIVRIGNRVEYYYQNSSGQFILLAAKTDAYTGDGRLALVINSWPPNFPSITSTFNNFSAKVNFLSVPTPTPAPCLTLPTFDTFSSGNLDDSPLWNRYYSSLSGSYVVDQIDGVLKASIISSQNGLHAGVASKNQVCGDFDVNVDFNQFTSSGQAEADARLSIIHTQSDSEILIQRYSKDNEQGFWANIKKNGVWGLTTGKASSTTSTSGKLRIRRQGTVFTTYFDTGNGWLTLGTFPDGFNSNGNIVIGAASWDKLPSVSASFDNFSLTAAIPEPSYTPVPTLSPTPTITLTPTPPSGREKYQLDVGNKQFLLINVGPAQIPLVRFKIKLAHVQNRPELYLRMRVRDELAFINNPAQAASANTCQNPPAGAKDFFIPMKAAGEVYSPVPQIGGTPPSGAKPATTTPDGFVMLEGVVPGKYYTLSLKSPKTRSTKMAEHVLLQPNQNKTIQDFDWAGNPLLPGDLPDPNNGNKQDCVVNSVDISLIKSRLGATDGGGLDIADINYDGVVNGNDISKVVNTLSAKPDDE